MCILLKTVSRTCQEKTYRPAQIDKFTITVADFKTPLTLIDKCNRKKSVRTYLNSTINQLDLIYIYINISTTVEYIFFSTSHETFTKTDHSHRHKTRLNKFKRTEIIQSMLMELNYKSVTERQLENCKILLKFFSK